jgi:hypothetical protein
MRRCIPAVLLCLAPLFAQQPASPPADDHQLVLQLLQRVNDLEAEVKRLKGEPAATAMAPATPPVSAAAPVQTAQVPPAPAAQTGAAPPDTGMGDMHGMSLPDVAGIQFRGFADVGFAASQGTPSTFKLGPFDLFMTSKLSDKFSVLAEMVLEYDRTNTIGIDLERMELHYNPSDYLNLKFGRFHSAIGYFNTEYHHASWLYNTVERPFLFAFEDQGGILPTHNEGVSATGIIPSGALGLHYVAEMGNGRTSHDVNPETASPIQGFQDESSRKSYDLAVYARPSGIPGLQTGFSMYQDRLYPTAGPKIGESIWDGYVAYRPPSLEFTTEVIMLRHAIEGTNRIYHIPAFYTMLAKNLGGGVRPYFSWEYLNVPAGEPLWGQSIGLRHGPSTGIRYDFTEFAAFKIEYFRLMRRLQNDVNGVRAQIAFTF